MMSLEADRKNYPAPSIYSRSYFNSNSDYSKYPETTLTNDFYHLADSNFVKVNMPYVFGAKEENQDLSKFYEYLKMHYPTLEHNTGVTMSKIDPELISSSVTLDWDWEDQNNFGTYDEESWKMFQRDIDLEFKHVWLFSKLKSDCYPNEPVSKMFVDNLISNYLNNLVHTRGLYKDFMEFKNYITSQKKRKRDNHKRNLRDKNQYIAVTVPQS